MTCSRRPRTMHPSASDPADPDCPFKAHYAIGERGVLRSLALRRFKQWRGILPMKRVAQTDHARRNRNKVGVSRLISGLSRPRHTFEPKPVWTRFAYFADVVTSTEGALVDAVKLETASELNSNGNVLRESIISVKKEEVSETVESIQKVRDAVASNPLLQKYAALAESMGEVEGEDDACSEIEGEDDYLDDTWTDVKSEALDGDGEEDAADDEHDIIDAIRCYEGMYK
ncbi:hypothetical protein HDU81_001766 [Chytriomyces hyalinus]|nr:hypothetical protein HDU81_001766 [Chytriomyces hyalinus]